MRTGDMFRWWLLATTLVTVTTVGLTILRNHSIHLRGHEGGVFAVVVSPDGKTIYSGSDDTAIRFWNMQTEMTVAIPNPPEGLYPRDGKTKGTYYDSVHGHRAPFVNCMSISPNGKILVVGAGDKSIRFWDIATKKQIRKIVLPYRRPNTKIGNAIRGIAISPDGKTVATASEDNLDRVWSMETGELERV